MKENSKMSKTKKWLIAIAVIIFFYLVANLSNSNSSSSGTINACDCAEKWLATPKRFMKATDKWKYDACVREYGGWAGAHSACNP